jgi:hypothetical protein
MPLVTIVCIRQQLGHPRSGRLTLLGVGLEDGRAAVIAPAVGAAAAAAAVDIALCERVVDCRPGGLPPGRDFAVHRAPDARCVEPLEQLLHAAAPSQLRGTGRVLIRGRQRALVKRLQGVR